MCASDEYGVLIWTFGHLTHTGYRWGNLPDDYMYYFNWIQNPHRYHWTRHPCIALRPAEDYRWDESPCWVEACFVCDVYEYYM